MNRRQMFVAAASSVALLPALASTPSLRAVHRYNYASDKWTRVRMYELRAGDVFRLESLKDNTPGETFIAAENPRKHPDGVWGITACWQLDPATNQWVECRG